MILFSSRRTKTAVVVFVSVSALIVFYFLWKTIVAEDWYSLKQNFSWQFGLGALIFYAAAIGAKALRFRFSLGDKISFGQVYSVAAMHSFWNNILPFRSGELSYVYLLKKTGKVSDGESIMSLGISRIFDLMVVVVFAIISSLLIFSETPFALNSYTAVITLIVLSVVFLLILAVVYNSFFIKMLGWLARGTEDRSFSGLLLNKTTEALAALSFLRSFKKAIGFLALSFLVWIGDFIFVWSALNAGGLILKPTQAVFMTAFPVAAAVFPLHTPAGFGTFEASVTGGLLLLGIKTSEALVASLFLHLQLLFSSLLLFVFFFGTKLSKGLSADKKNRDSYSHTRLYMEVGNMDDDFRNSNLVDFLMPHIKGPKVLDMGCGSGSLVAKLDMLGFDAEGVEPDQVLVDLAKRSHENIKITRNCLEDFRSDTLFDTVVLVDVLECIKDDRLAVRKAAELVAPQGRLIVVAPAIPGLYGSRDKSLGYHRRYSIKSLAADLESEGLRIIKKRYWNMLGVGPYFILYKILKKRAGLISVRGAAKKGLSRIISRALFYWFGLVENKLNLGFGLSCVIVAERTAKVDKGVQF